ncbi:hypothetical protein ABENE_01720 [Asticcacaulis benevestitus DSM 16100 = ATCC BAA-896]|uniref:Uncharacterized protein n=1 Tax=Asticcacaulis benevestitus DSM 16100 = ATCC BAA-896 TaxID=1121022 RepID=V4PJW3_9CAUL|nr:hypothetical protein ABENE_01720 [Asticcacaulis benevestitus DSM 16100 = ATCC BAA-896]
MLGGLQNVLYIPGLIWLLAVLLRTVGIARLFQVKRNNVLFLGTSIALALVLSTGLCAYLARGDYQLIGQKVLFIRIILML